MYHHCTIHLANFLYVFLMCSLCVRFPCLEAARSRLRVTAAHMHEDIAACLFLDFAAALEDARNDNTAGPDHAEQAPPKFFYSKRRSPPLFTRLLRQPSLLSKRRQSLTPSRRFCEVDYAQVATLRSCNALAQNSLVYIFSCLLNAYPFSLHSVLKMYYTYFY